MMIDTYLQLFERRLLPHSYAPIVCFAKSPSQCRKRRPKCSKPGLSLMRQNTCISIPLRNANAMDHDSIAKQRPKERKMCRREYPRGLCDVQVRHNRHPRSNAASRRLADRREIARRHRTSMSLLPFDRSQCRVRRREQRWGCRRDVRSRLYLHWCHANLSPGRSNCNLVRRSLEQL